MRDCRVGNSGSFRDPRVELTRFTMPEDTDILDDLRVFQEQFPKQAQRWQKTLRHLLWDNA